MIGGSGFFIIKLALISFLGIFLLAKYTKTIIGTLFSAAVYIATWLFFVNSWIGGMYFQEIIITGILFLGVLVASNKITFGRSEEGPD